MRSTALRTAKCWVFCLLSHQSSCLFPELGPTASPTCCWGKWKAMEVTGALPLLATASLIVLCLVWGISTVSPQDPCLGNTVPTLWKPVDLETVEMQTLEFMGGRKWRSTSSHEEHKEKIASVAHWSPWVGQLWHIVYIWGWFYTSMELRIIFKFLKH